MTSTLAGFGLLESRKFNETLAVGFVVVTVIEEPEKDAGEAPSMNVVVPSVTVTPRPPPPERSFQLSRAQFDPPATVTTYGDVAPVTVTVLDGQADTVVPELALADVDALTRPTIVKTTEMESVSKRRTEDPFETVWHAVSVTRFRKGRNPRGIPHPA